MKAETQTQTISLRDLKYSCGCDLHQEGIKICTLHLVIFEDLLKNADYNGSGWDVNQETYNKIVQCLNAEEQERREFK